MRRTLLPILFALLFACGNLWAGGLFPGTGGGGGAADEITYDNSTSGLSATNVKDALDEVTTMAGTGGLASVDDLPGDTVDDNKIDVGLLPTGTTSSTLSLGNHTHASLYQPLDTDLTTWAGVTPSANGQALVAAANYAAMRGLLDLEAGTDFNAYSATLNTLSGLTLTGNSKYIGTNSSGEAGVYDLPSGAGMVYPGAGIPVSTGSAWGTSITDNHTNWDAGYTYRVISASGTSPLTLTLSENALSGSIASAAADGSTKGVAAFSADDFNASSGVISIDYANGQKASSSVPGFLSAADWATFNAKAASSHSHSGVDITSGTVGIDYLPTGTTGITVALGNHTHSGVYQTYDADLDVLAGLTLTGNSKYLGTNSSGVAGVYDLPSGSGMVYPGAGVPNSTGSAWGTSYTVGTSANNLVQLNASAQLPAVSGANLTSVNAATLGGATFAAPGAIGGTTPAAGTFTTLSAGASGFGVDADGDVTAKSLTIAKVSGTAGTLRAYEANSTDTSTVGWMGPASISASWDYQFSSTQPAANSIMLFGAPSSNISAQTWITLDDTGTNGDTAKIWSADKCYDQLALKADASHNHSGTYQPLDSDLTTYAGITPSANVQSFLGAADFAAMRSLLSLVPGTNVQAYDADLGSLSSGITGLVKGAGNGNGYTAATAGTDYSTSSSTETLTNKTLDANGTGNTVKGYGYITLRRPNNRGSATGAVTTTETDINYGMPSFADDVESNNYIDYYLEVPRDLDTSVDLVAWFKFRLGGADTGDHDYIISMVSIADSAAQAGSPSNAVNLSYTADASGASGDIETAGGDTLTNWKSNLTAGNLWLIRITRDGDDSTNDSSTVDSYPVELTIRYGFTQ